MGVLCARMVGFDAQEDGDFFGVAEADGLDGGGGEVEGYEETD